MVGIFNDAAVVNVTVDGDDAIALGKESPLSSPCIPPKPVLHGLSARSKFLHCTNTLP